MAHGVQSVKVKMLFNPLGFAIPKLLHVLRCSPTWKANDQLLAFDEVLRRTLESVCNIKMDGDVWSQATLPTSKGGLGIIRSQDLALPAFLSSTYASSDLVRSLLPADEVDSTSNLTEGMDLWRERSGKPLPSEELRIHQRVWDEALVDKSFNEILDSTAVPSSRAVSSRSLQKNRVPGFNVLPSPHLGTKLDDNSIRIATGLRLGANIVVRHTCVCGSIVESFGHHGLSCRKSGGRISRHQSANGTIRRALVCGRIPAVLEPVGVSREDGKRPDGMSLIPWKEGRPLSCAILRVVTLWLPVIETKLLLALVSLRAQPSHSKYANILP